MSMKKTETRILPFNISTKASMGEDVLMAEAQNLGWLFRQVLSMPHDQRRYGWSCEMALKLAKDVQAAASRNGPFFLGSFATARGKDEAMYLYDGLQRMTTLTLMMFALWVFAKNEFGEKNATTTQEIRGLLFGGEGILSSDDTRRFHLVGEDERHLAELFDKLHSLDHVSPQFLDHKVSVLARNFSCLYSAFSSPKSGSKMTVTFAKHLVEFVRGDSVKIIHVRASPSFIKEIFMVLNTPGMAAYEGDLIKARLAQVFDSAKPGGPGSKAFGELWGYFSNTLDKRNSEYKFRVLESFQRICNAMQPHGRLLENVVGHISHNLDTFLRHFADVTDAIWSGNPKFFGFDQKKDRKYRKFLSLSLKCLTTREFPFLVDDQAPWFDVIAFVLVRCLYDHGSFFQAIVSGSWSNLSGNAKDEMHERLWEELYVFVLEVEKCAARFAVCNVATERQEMFFRSLLRAVIKYLSKAQVGKGIREMMGCFLETEGMVSDFEVQRGLQSLNFGRVECRGLMVYLLLRTEDELRSVEMGLTLEHIVHQTEKDVYTEDKKTNDLWKHLGTERINLLHCWGNLCLLNENDNSKCGSMPLEKKVPFYLGSALKRTQEMGSEKYLPFTPASCRKREQDIIGMAESFLRVTFAKLSSAKLKEETVIWVKRKNKKGKYHSAAAPCARAPKDDVKVVEITRAQLFLLCPEALPCFACFKMSSRITKADLDKLEEKERKGREADVAQIDAFDDAPHDNNLPAKETDPAVAVDLPEVGAILSSEHVVENSKKKRKNKPKVDAVFRYISGLKIIGDEFECSDGKWVKFKSHPQYADGTFDRLYLESKEAKEAKTKSKKKEKGTSKKNE